MTSRNDLRTALLHPNVAAFLRAIRLGEGTSGPDGYHIIVGGGRFDDFSRHPNVLIALPNLGVKSTAAGAYQIIYRTWEALRKQYGLEDFSPENQDQAAVALIAGRRALDAVFAGRLKDAVALCAAEWASLPGSTAGQRTENMASVMRVYVQAGGAVAVA